MKNGEKIPYSKLELKILRNIPDDGRKINSVDLTLSCYPLTGKRPRFAKMSIVGTANKLIAKSDENQEEWEIFRSRHKGSQPIYFWKEKRKEK